VLSVFSGIGSDILVLKRLGISIGTMIFVEHDRVAMHVIKHNHDCTYNKNLPIDGIKYMYIGRSTLISVAFLFTTIPILVQIPNLKDCHSKQ
jgi:site-specific DNA-cytosine methylase